MILKKGACVASGRSGSFDSPLPACYDGFVFDRILSRFVDLLYPHACIICQKTFPGHNKSAIFCNECRELFVPNIPPICRRCSRPLEPSLRFPTCADCARNPPHFDKAWAAYRYQEPVRRLIFQFKYGQMTLLRHGFERLLFDYLQANQIELSHFHFVVPMPLSTARLRERGFNQAQFLAQSVGQHFQIPLENDNLLRSRHTRFQATLSPKDRFTNVEGAFRIKYPRRFFGKAVLLVDDLLTTGATASEASLLLKMAGAKNVSVLTLAVA